MMASTDKKLDMVRVRIAYEVAVFWSIAAFALGLLAGGLLWR
jgi:hypothetical protein